MTALVPKRSAGSKLPLLAERMDISQKGEIELMQSWLEARGQSAPALTDPHEHAHGSGGKLMPGMLTEDQLTGWARLVGGRSTSSSSSS